LWTELLATIKLAGLLNNQAERDAARDARRDPRLVHRGLRYRDLKDAKALLEELN
jgi:hypothetical protein